MEKERVVCQDINECPASADSDCEKASKRYRHKNDCCCDAKACESYGPAVVVKPTSLNRILYTNPVCLLTSVANKPTARSESVFPRENVMTITWLTPTDTDGGLFLSINADRHSIQNILATRRFVLNVPVAGMEDLVKTIGKCSGRDGCVTECPLRDDAEQCLPPSSSFQQPSKLERLGIKNSSFAWKHFSALSQGDCDGEHIHGDEVLASQHDFHKIIDEVMQRSFLGDKGPRKGASRGVESDALPLSDPSAQYQRVYTSIADSLAWGDVIINDCVAHVVCEVVGFIPPIVAGNNECLNNGMIGIVGTAHHYSMFAQMKVAAVRKRYWTRGVFQPDSTDLPPYLTFLGQGSFLHSTLPRK